MRFLFGVVAALVAAEALAGEFSANGLNGSNLVNKKGYIGLWRSFTVDAGAYTKSDAGMDSGTAVWYMPTIIT